MLQKIIKYLINPVRLKTIKEKIAYIIQFILLSLTTSNVTLQLSETGMIL